jgi:hypothetical protein
MRAKVLGLMALLSGVFAILIGWMAWRHWREYCTGTPMPVDVPLAALANGGASTNMRVHVTDLEFGPVCAIEANFGIWERVWVPVLSNGRVLAVVKTTAVKDDAQLREFCSRQDVTGIVTNDLQSLRLEKLIELTKNYPGVRFHSIPVIEEGRTLPTPGSIWGEAGVTAELSILAAVVGLAALFAALRKERRMCRSEGIATAEPSHSSNEGSGDPRRAEGLSAGVTVAAARPVGEGIAALRAEELPISAGIAATSSREGRDLGALRRFFPNSGFSATAIGCGSYWLLLFGGIAALGVEQAKPDQFFWTYCFLGMVVIPAVFFISVGILALRDSAALYDDGVVSWRWSRATACRWDEVERLAGELRVYGRSYPGRASETLRLHTVDGRTMRFGAVRDMDELADAIYEEVLRRRQLPQALAAIRRGETVSVGPLLVRGDGIGEHDGRWLRWDDVEEVGLFRERIVVRRYLSRSPWWSGSLANLNTALLLELATACRRAEFG